MSHRVKMFDISHVAIYDVGPSGALVSFFVGGCRVQLWPAGRCIQLISSTYVFDFTKIQMSFFFF